MNRIYSFLKSTLLHTFILHSIVFSAAAQVKLSGTAKDSEGNTLQNVSIAVLGTTQGTYSDESGVWAMTLKKGGKLTIVASSIGYSAYNQVHQIDSDTEINIILVSARYEMPGAIVTGEKGGIFERIPGSAGAVTSEQLKTLAPMTGNEAFRSVAGVHVVDEEGAGLRMNLGLRGLDPDRSRSVLVLEDGIPVALAPYGEPELYYTPNIDRMESLEVLKGSGSILFGPQTIGGVINYVTAAPPTESKGSIRLRGGTGGYANGQITYGNTIDKAGFLISYNRKQADAIGMTSFDLDDFMGKITLATGDKSSIGLKIGYYREKSNSTYLGLTQSMFDNGEFYTIMAPHDRLFVNRISGSLNHNYFLSEKTRWVHTAFAYETERNWKRQDFTSNSINSEGVLGPKPSNYSGTTWGDESIHQGAIYMRNSTGWRNRAFRVAGYESKLSHDGVLFGLPFSSTTGGRVLREITDEQRINGTIPEYDSGSLVEDETRSGTGLSSFAHANTDVSKRLSLTAGLRYENMVFDRNIKRRNFGSGVRDTSLINQSVVKAIIPGAGFNLNLGKAASIFGGLHRGFAPPRTKDAITNLGESLDLEAEKSWNYELGVRFHRMNGIRGELNFFYMDFSNQIIPVAESAGGTGTGFVNGGRTTHRGAEAALTADLGQLLQTEHQVSITLNATYVEAIIGSDRFKIIDGENVNISGNRTPYAPNYLANAIISYQSPFGFGASVRGTFVGDQFSDLENTVHPSNNGREGLIPAYQLFDGSLWYLHKKSGVTAGLSVKNFSDERYIATRRPQGIRAGAPMLLIGSISYEF
jgi:Fe(3+) dicitrate transport protein